MILISILIFLGVFYLLHQNTPKNISIIQLIKFHLNIMEISFYNFDKINGGEFPGIFPMMPINAYKVINTIRKYNIKEFCTDGFDINNTYRIIVGAYPSKYYKMDYNYGVREDCPYFFSIKQKDIKYPCRIIAIDDKLAYGTCINP